MVLERIHSTPAGAVPFWVLKRWSRRSSPKPKLSHLMSSTHKDEQSEWVKPVSAVRTLRLNSLHILHWASQLPLFTFLCNALIKYAFHILSPFFAKQLQSQTCSQVTGYCSASLAPQTSPQSLPSRQPHISLPLYYVLNSSEEVKKKKTS